MRQRTAKGDKPAATRVRKGAKTRRAPKTRRRYTSPATKLQEQLAEALQQQAATSEVLRIISSSPGELEPVFQAILANATRICEASYGVMWLRDGDAFRSAAIHGALPQAYIEQWQGGALVHPSAEAPLASILRTRKVVQIRDLRESRAYLERDPLLVAAVEVARIRTLLLVPMFTRDALSGAIAIYRREIHPFADKQIELVTNFAAQAVIAVENARLFNGTKEALERQTATADILKIIASSPSDVKPVFDAIATRAKSLLGGFSSTVFRFMDGMAHLEALTPTTPEADEILKSTFPRPVADFMPFRMTQTGEVMQIPDTDAPTYELRNIARARGYRSMLYAPLVNKGLSIGFIAVTRVEPGTFSDHHVELLRTFADQAVIAIENARLFNEVQAKTRDLTEALDQQIATGEVLKAISHSAFDLQPVFDAIAENSVKLCHAERAFIFRFDGQFLRAISSFNVGPEVKRFVDQNPIALGRHSISARAGIERRTVHVADVHADPEYAYAVRDVDLIRTILAVPMLKSDELVGVITIYRLEVKPFTHKQVSLVETFAAQAVIAVENTRLINELRQSLDDLRTAQDRLVQTEKLASLGQLTAGVAHEIKNPLNFVNNFSALSAELVDEMNEVLADAGIEAKKRAELDEIRELLKSNLEKVVQHGKRADSIVRNMLLHSRQGSGEQRPVEINALVDESLNLAYHGARAEKTDFKIILERDFDPGAGMAKVYPQEITRVLLNLISNGFYAATRRGSEAGNGFEPKLWAATKDLGDKIEIRVRDNGTGIPSEIKDKIFTPFFTTKPAGEGTGLGLSMSHDIVVKQHGGTIDLETEPGSFTEFIITLPRESADQKNAGATT